jgi:hypothetical protein
MAFTDEENRELWKLPAVEAVPIIMEKFGISQSEAYKLWYDNLNHDKVHVIDEVVALDTDEKSNEYKAWRKRNVIATFRLGSSKNSSNEKSSDE